MSKRNRILIVVLMLFLALCLVGVGAAVLLSRYAGQPGSANEAVNSVWKPQPSDMDRRANAGLSQQCAEAGLSEQVEVAVALEHQSSTDGTWLTGARFEVSIDGKARPEYTAGFIGVGETREESERYLVNHWLLLFGSPFCAAHTRADGVEAGNFLLYSGPVQIRGNCPGWGDAGEATERAVHQLVVTSPELIGAREPRMVVLQAAVNETAGAFDGECRIGGSVSDPLLEQVLQLNWPRGDYMFKQTLFVVARETPTARDNPPR